jgi:hypothetical protein
MLGQLPITEKQAGYLDFPSHQRISPALEECCWRASATVSYKNAEKDLQEYTGIRVSKKTLQRIVHRHQFPEEEVRESIQEISLDGGKVRLRTETKGEPCAWKDYKAICTDKRVRKAPFRENEALIEWVNRQELSDPLTCLGDGHPGIGKLIGQIEAPGQKREILDWFHLVENLYKVGGSVKRLREAESLLGKGKVEETIALFSSLSKKQAENFCHYLRTHCHRILNYSYYQEKQICSIGSGAVESTIKQIDRRLQITGA